MKALIFAAGIGSRLKPWTDHHPKALVEVDGKPMLAQVIEKLVSTGITDIIINVHHFAEQITYFLSNNDFGANIIVSDETQMLLETGGGLRNVINLLDNQPVLVHNADIMTDFNLSEIISAHRDSGADITLLTASRKTSRYLVFDSSGFMKGWTNILTNDVRPSDLVITSDFYLQAFNGVHIIEPVVYKELQAFRPPLVPFSIMDFYIEKCCDMAIKSFKLPEGASWFDIGKPETLEKARKFYKTKHIL